MNMIAEHEGSIPNGPQTLDQEGEEEQQQHNNNNNNVYTNEEEKELHTFLTENKLLMMYETLKTHDLYLEHLKSIKFDREEYNDLVGKNGLNLKPHLKIRLKTAIQSLQVNENIPDIIALQHNKYNIMQQQPGNYNNAHYYPPPLPINSVIASSIVNKHKPVNNNNDNMIADINAIHKMYPSPKDPAPIPATLINNDNQKTLERVMQINQLKDDEKDNSDIEGNNIGVIQKRNDIKSDNIGSGVIYNYGYRIMILFRCILFFFDYFLIDSINIGGWFGSILLFFMEINGMYNICKPFSSKSGSLSILIALSELCYFICRDSLSFICYQDLYPQSYNVSDNQLHNFIIHGMLTLVLSVCLGKIIWEYRSQIFNQLHSSKWNIFCNYLMYIYVTYNEYNTLKNIIYGNEFEININKKLEKIYSLLNVFFITENIFIIVIILTAPPWHKNKTV